MGRQKPAKADSPPPKVPPTVWLGALALIGVFALAFYQVYGGASISSLGGPGVSIGFHPRPKPDPKPIASREFFVGRWRVEQDVRVFHGNVVMTYAPDGTCDGRQQVFQNGAGREDTISCRWSFEKLSDSTFRLVVDQETSGQPNTRWRSTFEIVNSRRIHNVDMNYDAVRDDPGSG